MKLQRKITIRRIIILIFIILLINIIFFVIPTFIMKKKNGNIDESKKINTYNLVDLIKYNIEENLIKINNDSNSEIVYENTYDINIDYNSNEDLVYAAYFYVDNELKGEINLESGSNEIEISSLSEGTHNIKIEIKNEETVIKSFEKQISYIKKYEKQFLDELNENGVSWHIGNLSVEEINKAIELQKNMGIHTIRIEIKSSEVMDTNGNINLDKYDEKMNIIKKSNMNAIVILDTNMGTDGRITNAEEMEKYKNYVKEIATRYSFLNCFEVCNEPNWYYKTDEEISLYVDVVKETRRILPDKTILIGSTMQYDSDNWSEEDSYDYDRFLKKITDYGAYPEADVYTYHVYTLKPDNNQLTNYIESQNELQNSIGGFQKLYITETGLPSIERIGEEKQAETFIQQKNLINEGGITGSITYNFRNTGTNIINYEHNYGLVHNDYTPKLSYYAMKNYYENTNGAEYIGTVNLADGLEAHVYDKDGKPKIIAWSDNADNTITIPYKNFTASDIYGNEIENTDGTLEITTSPVYLDNISDEYFYEAISNTTLEKYEEFEEKFEAEIANINGLREEINKLKEYMASIASNSTEDENIAIEQMNAHFNLGNVILSAYKNGSLDVEYVKLSSMLDMLNDIGDSYEDLLTVCATTRAPYYTATEELINSAENKINNNSDLEIVYPSKILDFAKELDEKSEYINSLSEENDIKTGLIVSNSLHAYYLADWANEFASIYIDEYIEANPVTVSYSNSTEWTNEDVVATLNIGNDATVTNNGGSNIYTFRSNGSFTFEYERRGQAFTLEAKVSNIDKTYPTITGVKDGQTYTSSVKPVIEDTNLSIVSISYNGENIEYYDGITLEDEGIYSIVATDRAGNTTTVEFNIISEMQDNYIIKDNYLLNVWQETTLTDFKNNYTSQGESYTIKRNDTELTDTDIIATGDTIELSSGDTYTIVVAGDINCDGRVTVFDFSALRRYILKQIEFTEIELLAADINIDSNDVGVKDYSRMRIEILGRY